MGVTPALGKGTLGTWRAHRQRGGRAQNRPYTVAKRWVEAVVKPEKDGAYVYQHLNLCSFWEGPRKKGQGFKPDLGKPAVRHYRGAAGNVSHGGNVNPSCNRKSRNGNPPSTAGRARVLSQLSSRQG